MSLPVHSSEEFRSNQQSRDLNTRSVCVCLRLILNQVENITKTTSRNKIKVAVVMATREMAISPPIFNRELSILRISALLYVQSFYIPILEFC